MRTLGAADDAPIVVHPTAGWRLKTWPIERWSNLVSRLAQRLGGTVLVAGTARDTGVLNAIAERAGCSARVLHDVSIGMLAEIHAAARLVVGMDSGALHLAAFVGAPVVGLFGPFAPARVAPVAPRNAVRTVWRSLPCSPCGTLEAPPCRAVAQPPCLLAISVDDVVEAAAQLIAEHDSQSCHAKPGGDGRAHGYESVSDRAADSDSGASPPRATDL